MPAKPVMTQEDFRSLAKKSFGKSFWIMAALAGVSAAVCFVSLGPDAFKATFREDTGMLADLLPRVIAAQILAALVWILMPRDRVSEFMRRNHGKRGLLLATVAGVITPGGPVSAYPLLALLAASGADRGILVAYITGWALLGVQRIVVWDIPLMGLDFSLLRFCVCLPLPILAGMIARWLPFTDASITNHSRSGEN